MLDIEDEVATVDRHETRNALWNGLLKLLWSQVISDFMVYMIKHRRLTTHNIWK